jgi:hypothetical protein
VTFIDGVPPAMYARFVPVNRQSNACDSNGLCASIAPSHIIFIMRLHAFNASRQYRICAGVAGEKLN